MFWKISKQILNLGRPKCNIPTLKVNREVAESDFQKAKMLNTYFSSQCQVDDINKKLPNISTSNHILHSINISIQDVLDVLKNLNTNKACGPDLISPRLLKEGAPS